MSAALPTEEDVLAALLLVACRPVVTNCTATAQLEEVWAYDAAIRSTDGRPTIVGMIARSRLEALGSIEAALVDSERLWEVDRARDAVIEAARIWDGQGGLRNLDLALADYDAALLLANGGR